MTDWPVCVAIGAQTLILAAYLVAKLTRESEER